MTEDMKILTEHRQKVARGLMLRILKAERLIAGTRPPAPVDLLVIQSILTRFGIYKSWDYMLEQVDYLEQRHYVRSENIDLCGIQTVLVEITERGLAVTDHKLSDDTILLGE